MWTISSTFLNIREETDSYLSNFLSDIYSNIFLLTGDKRNHILQPRRYQCCWYDIDILNFLSENSSCNFIHVNLHILPIARVFSAHAHELSHKFCREEQISQQYYTQNRNIIIQLCESLYYICNISH